MGREDVMWLKDFIEQVKGGFGISFIEGDEAGVID